MPHSDLEKRREYDKRRYAETAEQRREYSREYQRRKRAENPERLRENNRRWYKKNAADVKEDARRRREANPERHRANNRQWRAENPEHVKENNQRWYRKHKATPEYRMRRRKYEREWRAENPAIVKANSHRRLARKLSVIGDFTAEQFNALCTHFNHHCLKCGRPRKLTADHVTPLAFADRLEFVGVALGDIDNIQPLCGPCNSSKRDRYVDYRTRPHRNCINPPMVEDYLA